MSFGITIDVSEDGSAEIVSITRGDYAKPPAGRYSILGHVHRDGDAASSIGVSTPMGASSSWIKDAE